LRCCACWRCLCGTGTASRYRTAQEMTAALEAAGRLDCETADLLCLRWLPVRGTAAMADAASSPVVYTSESARAWNTLALLEYGCGMRMGRTSLRLRLLAPIGVHANDEASSTGVGADCCRAWRSDQVETCDELFDSLASDEEVAQDGWTTTPPLRPPLAILPCSRVQQSSGADLPACRRQTTTSGAGSESGAASGCPRMRVGRAA